MGYKFFKDKRYWQVQKHTVEYLEKELISKSDVVCVISYFGLLIARIKRHLCMRQLPRYYLALATKGAERAHYMLGWRGRQLILHCHGTIHGMSLLPARSDVG